jgi:hypothetical protein
MKTRFLPNECVTISSKVIALKQESYGDGVFAFAM